MAAELEHSFTLEELEISELEHAAENPNDHITSCTCRGFCLRENGRNACPCKSASNFCSSACHGEDFGTCMNNRRVLDDSDSDTVSFIAFYYAFFPYTA